MGRVSVASGHIRRRHALVMLNQQPLWPIVTVGCQNNRLAPSQGPSWRRAWRASCWRRLGRRFRAAS